MPHTESQHRRSHARQVLPVLIVSLTVGLQVHGAAPLDGGKTPIQRSTTDNLPSSSSTGGARSGGMTLSFLGVLLAGAIIVRRVVQQRTRGRNGVRRRNCVTLIDRQRIDEELTVRVLKIGSKVLLVGSSPQGLATLAEVSDPAEIALLTGDESSADSAASTRPLFADRSRIARTEDVSLAPVSSPVSTKG